jgi:plasmid stabilization system protein ParE
VNFEFHPEAELEFIESAARFESEVPGLGIRFGAEVLRTVELLLENPLIGADIGGDMRHWVLRRFPFSIVYWIEEETLHILAVAHGHREPEYWRQRRR